MLGTFSLDLSLGIFIGLLARRSGFRLFDGSGSGFAKSGSRPRFCEQNYEKIQLEVFCFFLFETTFTSIFKDKKSQ
jgi:hypothetical protein